MEFNCHSCGACCRQAGHIGLPHNGDYVCIHLKNNMCSIYEDRPDICRVKDKYREFKDVVSLDEWYSINEVACGSLAANEIKNK